MKGKTRAMLPLVVGVIMLCGGRNYGEIKDTGAYLKQSVVSKKLSNGVNVVMLNRGFSPTLALIISFRVGSVDESYRTIGAAHMLEHMLFKGTDRLGTKDYRAEKRILDEIEKIGQALDDLRLQNPSDKKIAGLQKRFEKLQKEQAKYVTPSPYDRIYTENGGVGFNASTSRDETAYYIELPADRLELWAEMESERLQRPVLREYYLERKAVMEERLMRYESNGISKLHEEFIALSFLAHPYRHPTIGWQSNIGFLSLREVERFYKTNYIPSRMTITVVGRQNTDETFRMLEKYFGKIERRNEASEIAVGEPAQKGEKRFELNFQSNPYLLVGWHKPTFPSRDDYVFDVIEKLLSEGKTSRLYRSLVLEKQIASSVDSWNGAPGARYNNLFVISAEPKYPHTPEELENAVYEEIEKLRIQLTGEEITKVQNRIESSMIFDLDSNKGVAHLLSYYQTIFGNWEYVVTYLGVMKSIGVSDVREVLDRYITRENRTVGILRDSRVPKK